MARRANHTSANGGQPSELAITLAALPSRYHTDTESGWKYADEIRGVLKLLGFNCTAQQVSAWLARMARTDAPWVETREDPWGGPLTYRVTRYGRCDIDNRLPGIKT